MLSKTLLSSLNEFLLFLYFFLFHNPSIVQTIQLKAFHLSILFNITCNNILINIPNRINNNFRTNNIYSNQLKQVFHFQRRMQIFR